MPPSRKRRRNDLDQSQTKSMRIDTDIKQELNIEDTHSIMTVVTEENIKKETNENNNRNGLQVYTLLVFQWVGY